MLKLLVCVHEAGRALATLELKFASLKPVKMGVDIGDIRFLTNDRTMANCTVFSRRLWSDEAVAEYAEENSVPLELAVAFNRYSHRQRLVIDLAGHAAEGSLGLGHAKAWGRMFDFYAGPKKSDDAFLSFKSVDYLFPDSSTSEKLAFLRKMFNLASQILSENLDALVKIGAALFHSDDSYLKREDVINLWCASTHTTEIPAWAAELEADLVNFDTKDFVSRLIDVEKGSREI